VAALDPREARLAAALRAARKAAGLSQADMAAATGWVQPKISRLETGAQRPTESDILTWARCVDAVAERTEQLLDMFSATQVEYTPTADLVRRGTLARRAAHLGAMEAAASRIGEYQPALIPGLLQVPAYSAALLRLPGSASRCAGDAERLYAEIIAARGRRAELLAEPGRRWQFVIGEPALWSAPGAVDVQITQLNHLLLVMGLSGVELGIVPVRARMPVMPLSGFRLLDEEFVYIETLYGEQRYSERIEPIIGAFEAARQAAARGPDAAALIARAAAEFRPSSVDQDNS
jgi:transcriptional regulator with XRE-family HTH domain